MVKAHLPLRPSPVFSSEDTCSLLCFVSHCRYWDQEVLRAEKDARKPSLTKAIIKCYWKSYVVLGIFTLVEVKSFYIQCIAFQCMWFSTEMDETCGERGQRIKCVYENLSVI